MNLSFAGFVLKERERELVGPSGQVELGARSFDVLCALLARPNELITKSEILDVVWPGLAVEENTLQVHLSALRKALGPSLITTVHGRGYKYVGPTPAKMASVAAPSTQPLSRRPVVAVLPLDNLSGDPGQQYFSDGITDDIIDRLSRYHVISVIGRHSSFGLRGQASEAPAYLTADYIVTGSIRKAGDRVRVAARLTQARTEATIWADHYDRPLSDVFGIQDELTRIIASTLVGRVEIEVATRPASAGAAQLSSYEHVLKGMWHFKKLTPEANAEAAGLFRQAIAEFPQNAQAHRWLSSCENSLWLFHFDRGGLERGLVHAERAIELDPTSADCYSVRGFCQLWLSGVAAAGASNEQALALNPGDPNILADAALVQAYRCDRRRLDPLLAEAYRLNPLPPAWYAEYRGILDFAEGNYAAAAPAFLAIPDSAFDVMYALACLGHLGDRAGIGRIEQHMASRGRRWDFRHGAMAEPFTDPEVPARLLAGLAKAGVVA